MEAGFRLRDSRLAIVGLGLMGGSLALALKGKCAALYGIDSHPATLELALVKQIVDAADSDPAKFLPQVDLVILAMPIKAIIDFIDKLPLLVERSCIVLDLGSTKKEIVHAMSTLPERFDPIGGHPICGKERLGLENADACLYRSAPFVITPLGRTTDRARNAAEQIVSTIGAHWIEMNADEHDRALAFTSHLPFLISSGLIHALPHEYEGLIGTGFGSASRLAGTPSHMMIGILQSNRENILDSIQAFSDSLNQIASILEAENYIQLEHLLNQSRRTHQSLVSNL